MPYIHGEYAPATAVNATKRATRILLREVICTKTADLAAVLSKLMQLKRVTDGHSH